MSVPRRYTVRVKAGNGLVDETLALFELWEPGLAMFELTARARTSGRFPKMTARSLRNLVGECFAPRYLAGSSEAILALRDLLRRLPRRDQLQLMLLHTARANPILGDFVRQVYWAAYGAGRDTLSSDDSEAFVRQALADGRTEAPWAEGVVRRVISSITGICADFGLLEPGRRRERKIVPLRPTASVIIFLAYDLHFAEVGDNTLLQNEDWALFGLCPRDVLEELGRLQRYGHFMVQSAGDLVRITWTYPDWRELTRVLTES